MPGYIGYRPQFDPISLQEYLTVPAAIIGEYNKAEDIYDETANKAEALKALLGERTPENEAGWKIVDNYERQLGSLAKDIANGIQGPEAYRAAKNSRRYYRENMLPLESGIPAYQKELERYNSDPSMIGAKPVLENYIKDPMYRGYMLSGDKIYADMVNQGKLAAADRSSSDVRKSGVTGYLNHITRVGYSPEEQQEYLGLINAALRGDETAVQSLQNNDKYSQLYKGLNAYMKDHAFDRLDNEGKINALNRAISGQLYGMTGTSKDNLIADKQWEHNSRMSAARSAASSSTVPPPPAISNHVIKPIARVASYGRQKYGLGPNNVFVKDNKTGKIRLNNNKLSLYRALGWISPLSPTGDTLKDSEISELYFNADGSLRTKDQANVAIKEANKKAGYNKYNMLDDNYDDFYMSLMDRVDMSQSFDDIITNGPAWRQTQSIDTNNRVKNFKNFLKDYANSLNEKGATNTSYYNYLIPIKNNDIESLLASLPERFTKFTGMSTGDSGLVYNSNGKAVKKADILKKAEKSGATLEFSPLAGGYILNINNEDEDRFFIPDNSFDRTMHNYTNIDWKGYDSQLSRYEDIMNNAYAIWQTNQTPASRQDYINAYNAYYNLLNQYNSQLGELEHGLLESDVFTSINEANPNTESFRKQQ